MGKCELDGGPACEGGRVVVPLTRHSGGHFFIQDAAIDAMRLDDWRPSRRGAAAERSLSQGPSVTTFAFVVAEMYGPASPSTAANVSGRPNSAGSFTPPGTTNRGTASPLVSSRP